jgi:hypothetical protein
MSRYRDVDRAGIDKLINFITNNPTASDKDIEDYTKRLGYLPQELIPMASGAIQSEKYNINMNKPLQEILEEGYELDRTPGRRLILDPNDIKTEEGYKYAHKFKDNPGLQGLAEYDTVKLGGKKVLLPTKTIVRDSKNLLDKFRQLSVQGHEFQHIEDILANPDFIEEFEKLEKPPIAGEPGHHFNQPVSFETNKLKKIARDLPDDTESKSTANVRRELYSKKLDKLDLSKLSKKDKDSLEEYKKGLVINPKFKKLMAVLGPIGALAGAGVEASEGNLGEAALQAASAVDPTGIAEAAVDIKRRLSMSPEELKKQQLEDKYTAMPGGPSPADIMLDQLEEEPQVPAKMNKLRKILSNK